MSKSVEIRVPDIGDFDEVDVVEVLVSAGDTIEPEQSLIVLESDKASMEVPAEQGGVVRDVKVKVGDHVSEGSVIATIDPAEDMAADGSATDAGAAHTSQTGNPERANEEPADTQSGAAQADAHPDDAPRADTPRADTSKADALELRDHRESRAPSATSASPNSPPPHASPSVRRFARELGVNLALVPATGRKGRLLAEDVRAFVKKTLAGGVAPGAGIPPVPDPDHGKFGPIEVVALSRVNRVSARNLHRSWLNVPHVTHFDEADITDLEEFRRAESARAADDAVKLTILSFVLVATAATLRKFPRFNASLLASGEELVLKRYVHIGVAVDTDDGLVVPVIRDIDKKRVRDLARELGDVSARAREGRLTAADWQGASFTISSLGGIGGTNFTPIVNAPEVAILGVSRAAMKPVHREGAFVPRLMLPFALSYDHRVIDGAAAARFCRELAATLTDLRRILL